MIKARVPGFSVDVLKVKNDFFGDTVTVAGLLTGVDMREAILEAIKEKNYTRVVIPHATLKADEDVFLCGMTLCELEEAVGLPVYAAKNDPNELVRAFLK